MMYRHSSACTPSRTNSLLEYVTQQDPQECQTVKTNGITYGLSLALYYNKGKEIIPKLPFLCYDLIHNLALTLFGADAVTETKNLFQLPYRYFKKVTKVTKICCLLR